MCTLCSVFFIRSYRQQRSVKCWNLNAFGNTRRRGVTFIIAKILFRRYNALFFTITTATRTYGISSFGSISSNEIARRNFGSIGKLHDFKLNIRYFNDFGTRSLKTTFDLAALIKKLRFVERFAAFSLEKYWYNEKLPVS